MYHRRWTEKMILDHLMARHGREPLNYNYYLNEYPDVHAAAIRHFGSWQDAIENCGLDYEKIRKYRRWSREKILAEIKKMRQAGQPLNSDHAQEKHKPLYMATVKRFKNWGRAIHAAGFDYKKILLRRQMGKAEIKEEILRLHRRKVDLAYPNMRAGYSYLLAAAMKKLGDGSWAAARRKCGILDNYRKKRLRRKT